MNMKRVLSLVCLLTLLTGCAARSMQDEAPQDGREPGANERVVSFVLTQDEYIDELVDDDGTVLLRAAWTLPRLTVQDENGALLDRRSDDVSLSPGEQRGLAVCETFNAEMAKLLEEKREGAEDLADMARSDIAIRKELEASGAGFGEFVTYADELSIVSQYQTDTLVSLCLLTYSSSGGAHPNSAYFTWNFDLTSGEFLTYEDFAADEAAFRAAVSDEIMDQIFRERLGEYYYEDYETYVENLAYANVCFAPEGMTVRFDEYTMGPHAAGTPTFFISYGILADRLGERGLALLSLPREAFLLADFYRARELWELFNLCSLKADYSSSIEVDGVLRSRVVAEGVSSLNDLRAMLCEYVSEDLADAWIAEGPYLELDGVLYTAAAGRGKDLTLGRERLTVELSGKGGEVVAALSRVSYNELTDSWDVGEETEERRFPFVLRDGGAVFTAFDAYW